MTEQARGEGGKFASKSDELRGVRSVRLTNSTWEKLGIAADLRCITRADLIEQLVESGLLNKQPTRGSISLQQVEEAVSQILNDSAVTRNGRDRGSVKRALETLLNRLS